MKFNVKTLAIVLGGGLGVLVVAAVLFFVFFPKELAVREAERRIEAATHRQLSLGHDIQVTFWPALGFSTDSLTISNPAGFDANQPFIAADRVTFAVALLPLLHGDVQVRQLILQNATINLRAKPSGDSNWTFPTENNSHDQNTIEDLRLDDVRLIHSNISFQGGDAQPPMQLQNVDASLTLHSLDSQAHFASTLTYRGEQVSIDSTIDKPRAVLEHGETPMKAHVQAAPLDANFDGAFNAQTGALQGQITASGGSLRRLLAWTGSPMEQGAGFGAYRLEAAMTHQDQQTALSDATIRLDNIQATGDLTLTAPPNGKLRVGGNLASSNIDLNTYMPAPAQGAQGGGVNASSGWTSDRIDLTGLRALDADLNLAVASLKFQHFTFSNVQLNLRVANGAADARLSRLALYGGSGTARMIADGSGATPRVAVEIDAQNIQAEPLLRDAVGFDKITGRGHLTASLAGQGASQAALMHGLHGNAAFTFNDGQIKGVNLAQIARTIQSALSGQATGPGAATDFAELSSTFQIANGVAATQNLRMLNPYIRVDGQGLIDIGNQSIDMRVAPRAVNTAQGQGGSATIAGLGIPFRIHGPWSHVGFAPALGDVVQNELRSRIGDVLGHQDQSSPLTQLGASLFGTQGAATTPATPTQSSQAQTPATAAHPATTQQSQTTPQSSGNSLQDALQRAIQRNNRHGNSNSTSTTTATPAPSSSP